MKNELNSPGGSNGHFYEAITNLRSMGGIKENWTLKYLQETYVFKLYQN